MNDQRQLLGQKGERLAAWYLKLCGYRVLEQNYRNRIGEIDIIAREGATLVFVEVKARKDDRFGPPKAAVTLKKQQKISQTALAYLKETRQMDRRARFDVVSIQMAQVPPRIELIRNAFELAYGI
ncbi:MAG: YraN family protein [Desulfobacterales bacterium]|nr:YraN family protein [Desulfobacterales bacterium]